VKQLWEKVKALKPYRANQRYNEVRGNLLSSGIAYYAFFSVFPAFAIAAVIFGFVLNGHPELLNSVGDALNQALPGFVKTTSNPDGLITLEAPQLSLLTIGGIVALVSLVLSGIGWIGSFRDGIRASLGAEGSPGNLLTDKLRDLGVFVAFGSAFLLSAVLTSVIGAAADWVAQRVGLGSNAIIVTVVGILVGFAVDVGILVLLLRVLSGVSLPWSAVRQSALVGGALLGIIKIFGLQLIGNATKNPLLGSVAIVIGLLFWLNLIARIVLLSACWAYLDTAHETAEEAEGAEGADPALDEGVAAGPAVQHTTARLIPPSTAAAGVADPTVARSRDRVAVMAGAVIGAAVATGVAGLLRRRSSP
jgi:membrane protein